MKAPRLSPSVLILRSDRILETGMRLHRGLAPAVQWACHGFNMILFYPREPTYLGLQKYMHVVSRLFCDATVYFSIQSCQKYILSPSLNTDYPSILLIPCLLVLFSPDILHTHNMLIGCLGFDYWRTTLVFHCNKKVQRLIFNLQCTDFNHYDA